MIGVAIYSLIYRLINILTLFNHSHRLHKQCFTYNECCEECKMNKTTGPNLFLVYTSKEVTTIHLFNLSDQCLRFYLKSSIFVVIIITYFVDINSCMY